MKSTFTIHFQIEDWSLWVNQSFDWKWWRVFIISEKIGHSGECFRSGNEEWQYSSFQRRLVTLENVFNRKMKSIHHFREDWSLWRMFLMGKWRVFIISEKIGYSGERFRLGNEWMYSSFQRRLVILKNVFDRKMKSIHHFREDWSLWRTFSIEKWRVFIISEKIGHSGECFQPGNEEYSSFQRRLVTLESIFDREMKSIHHIREDWSLWRMFSTGKWRVFIISEKIGYSGEHFRSGNEEYSSYQRRLVTLENVFDREMKSKCIHHFREDWSLWRTLSIGKWRVFSISDKIGEMIGKVNVFIISEKIGYSGECFWSGNEEWMYSSFQRRLENSGEEWMFLIREMSLWRTFSIGEWRVFIISEKIGYTGERFRSGNEWMYSSFQRRLVTLENVFDREMKWVNGERFWSGNEEYSSFQRRLVTLENVFDQEMKSNHFRKDWSLWRTFLIGKWRVFIISEKIGHSGERFWSGNEEWMYSSFQRRLVTMENVFDR